MINDDIVYSLFDHWNDDDCSIDGDDDVVLLMMMIPQYIDDDIDISIDDDHSTCYSVIVKIIIDIDPLQVVMMTVIDVILAHY